MFYSAFCSAYRTANNAKATDIPTLTSKISQAARESIRHAKRKLFTRMEIVTEMGAIAGDVCNLASNYFVAAMNAFRASNGGSTPTMSKTIQVSSIIDMLFVVGDSIEESFGEDFEIGKNIACECWKIGFECYENCNMPAPPKMYDQYLKVLKYDSPKASSSISFMLTVPVLIVALGIRDEKLPFLTSITPPFALTQAVVSTPK